MAFLTKDQILESDDTQSEIVPCPEWSGDVLVIGITAEQRDQYESSIFGGDEPNTKNMRARLCSMAICGEDRKPLFTLKDISALGQKSAAALDRCFQVAKRLGGIGRDSVEDAKKNSDDGPSDDSLSD